MRTPAIGSIVDAWLLLGDAVERWGEVNMAANMRVSCVICAFNEEEHIRNVLAICLKCAFIDEIIVVDDGSEDNTLSILREFEPAIRVISFPENRGKSYAMVAGIRAAEGDIIVFCDGDLVQIKTSHLEGIVGPLQSNLADQVLAIRETDLPPFKKLTGERGYFKKDLLEHADRLEKTKFGAETFLNHIFADRRTYLYLEPGLVQAGKRSGGSLAAEILLADEYVKAGYQILVELARQKEPHRSRMLRRSVQTLRDNYQRHVTTTDNSN